MTELTDEAVKALLDGAAPHRYGNYLHIANLARALLDARAENARLRADAEAANGVWQANLRLQAELAAAQQREARRTFPILKGDGAKIDYQLMADHAEQARSNHGQSVDRLAARGGLSWCELYAVLHNRKWEKVDTNEAMIACRSLEARYLAALSNNGNPSEEKS